MRNDIILALRDVTIRQEQPHDVGMAGVTFDLAAGELALFFLGERQIRHPLADAAEGLVAPDHGVVSFLGDDWQAMPPRRAGTLRGMIGRVFDGRGWIGNLDVDENVTLPQRYHTGLDHRDLMREADELARELGLGAVPRARPAVADRVALRAAEWVRAFLARPRLLILEEPMRGVPQERFENLARGVAAARGRNAAVLWITTSDHERSKVAPQADAVFVRHDDAFVRREDI